MAKTIEGYLVKSKYEKGGKKSEPKLEGVAFDEYEAREIIEREAVYYNDSWRYFNRRVTEDGVTYVDANGNEKIEYVIEKCLVIIGV